MASLLLQGSSFKSSEKWNNCWNRHLNEVSIASEIVNTQTNMFVDPERNWIVAKAVFLQLSGFTDVIRVVFPDRSSLKSISVCLDKKLYESQQDLIAELPGQLRGSLPDDYETPIRCSPREGKFWGWVAVSYTVKMSHIINWTTPAYQLKENNIGGHHHWRFGWHCCLPPSCSHRSLWYCPRCDHKEEKISPQDRANVICLYKLWESLT